MIINDIHTMQKSILEKQEKKILTKEELNLQNSILKQTKNLKDEEEKE